MSEPSAEIFHRRSAGNSLATFFAATRPAFLTASILPVIVGLALSWSIYGSIEIGLGLLTLLNIVLIHSGANVLNDYFDDRNGTDGSNSGRIFPFSGGSRFIQNGVLSRRETLQFGSLLMVSGALLGLWFALVAGHFILLIGLLGGILAIFYSAPPCLACRGLGDVVIAICFGILPVVGTLYIQSSIIDPQAIWVGAIIGCFVAAILWNNSIPDIDADRAAGKLTLPARLGAAKAPYGLALLFILGFALLPLSPLPVSSYITLLAVFPATAAVKVLLEGRLMPAIPLTLVTHAAVSVLLTVGLILAR
ncbi:hypothetical protein BOW53_00500 [Solemya pervernicosa gill symbiont]|uniref:1,4-dihydroxy-2-naphthoate octaprenyltransferase n=2 Tax=Gammaproteobacteria incertae sedis TaxID=118884 RepID=A0A1T2LBE9_9GAMM|nr:prenyltransferase [Candidatus Reidiella endopervernicosa]OOZ42354.1 hypothetical protein BOW53_00500 [Solemya pervernicosa gill symbiont]QKQ25743.1 prenyltransferase [Candidatus Reidiella endopervernicosa]